MGADISVSHMDHRILGVELPVDDFIRFRDINDLVYLRGDLDIGLGKTGFVADHADDSDLVPFGEMGRKPVVPDDFNDILNGGGLSPRFHNNNHG